MLALKEITNALGGQKLLGRKVESQLDVADLVLAGLPSKSAFFLQNILTLGDDEYAQALGVSSKWLGRYRKTPKAHLDAHVSDRLYRIARLFKLAAEVLESDQAANEWLHQPQMALGERTPLELMRTEVGTKEVEELLYRIEYGLYS